MYFLETLAVFHSGHVSSRAFPQAIWTSYKSEDITHMEQYFGHRIFWRITSSLVELNPEILSWCMRTAASIWSSRSLLR
jgi:hypothetical protein